MRRMLITIGAALGASTTLWGADAGAASGDLAGVAAAVRGEVTLVAWNAPAQAVGVQVASGQEIALGDRIATGAEAGMQVMLLDQTVFTIGPESAMTVDEFVFDPDSGAGKVTASIVKGAFRFVSGRVAKDAPENMEVNVPGAVIGVRGTTAMGTTDGTTTIVALVGAGPDNNAGERPGRIIVTSGGVSREIFRPGYFVAIEGPNLPPTPPAPLPPETAAGIAGKLTKQGGGAGPGSQPGGEQGGKGSGAPLKGGPSVVAQSGQKTAGALPGTKLARAKLAQLELADKTTDLATQSSETLTEVSTFGQLRLVNSGQVSGQLVNVPLNVTQGAGNGTYSLNGTIDFGARSISLNGSLNYQLGGSPAQNVNVNDSHNYAGETGFAANVFRSNGIDGAAFSCHPGCADTLKLGVAVINDQSAGVIADGIATKAKVTDGVNTLEGQAVMDLN